MADRSRPDETLIPSTVRIADATGRPAGVGFLVGPDLVCTAAHVLGAADKGSDRGGSEVSLTFVGIVGKPTVVAVVDLWRPDLDVAGLRLAAPAPHRAPTVPPA